MAIMSFRAKNVTLSLSGIVWWVRISITAHYNSIHIIINSQWVHIYMVGHGGKCIEKTHRCQNHDVYRHASFGLCGFTSELLGSV